MTTFARLLKARRLRAGWTQARLAIESGLHPGTLAHYEAGTRRPTWDAVQLLASALGVKVDVFAAEPVFPLRAKPKPAKKTVKAKAKTVKRKRK